MNLYFAEDTLPADTMCATIGLFDGVHLGHRHLFNVLKIQAAACGLKTLAVTFDQHPQHILQLDRPPISQLMAATMRINAIDEAGIENVLVLEFTEELAAMTSTEFMQLLHDKYGVARLVVGYNNKFGSDTDSTFDDYKREGARIGVYVFGATRNNGPVVSSTIIRDAIRRRGAIRQANLMLGREFSILGTVVKGNQVGSTIGFPTANVKPDSLYQLMPPPGAYAIIAQTHDGKRYPGMAGVSHRPSVEHDENADIALEVNLFDYDGGDLYDRQIAVFFIDMLRRGEVKFDSTAELKSQLEQDKLAAMQAIDQYVNNDD